MSSEYGAIIIVSFARVMENVLKYVRNKRRNKRAVEAFT